MLVVRQIRLQSQGREKLLIEAGTLKDYTYKYNGTFDAYRSIVAADGVLGLWRGLGPALARNATICAAELSTVRGAQGSRFCVCIRLILSLSCCHAV